MAAEQCLREVRVSLDAVDSDDRQSNSDDIDENDDTCFATVTENLIGEDTLRCRPLM